MVKIEKSTPLPLPSSVTKEELKIKGQAVSECILGNSYFTIAGVVGGLALTRYRKGIHNYFICVSAGLFADLFYGVYGNCRVALEEYQLAKKVFEAQEKLEMNKKEE
jgi:hypothetical protein